MFWFMLGWLNVCCLIDLFVLVGFVFWLCCLLFVFWLLVLVVLFICWLLFGGLG